MLIQVEKAQQLQPCLDFISQQQGLVIETYYYDDETDNWVHHTRMMVGDEVRCKETAVFLTREMIT